MKNKLNLKGQFNNSQTAVNPTEVGPATVSRRSRLMSVLCLLTLLTLGVGNVWGAWIGNSGINVNGTWYRSTNNIDEGNWLKGCTHFQDNNFGAITSLVLGGQYDTYDNNQTDQCSWNANNGIHILIKKGSTTIADFKLSCYHHEKSGNNNVWKTSGGTGGCDDSGSWGTYTVDISGYAAGEYTMKATWFSPSGQSLNNTAQFTIAPVVTFKANGGTGSDYTQRVTYNTNTALTANTFTKTGYKFAGWATTSDGSVTYADMANVKLTNHTILYAKWLPTTVTGTMSPNPATANTTTFFTFNATISNWISGQRFIIVGPDNGFLYGPVTITNDNIEWTSGALSYNVGSQTFKLRVCSASSTDPIIDDYPIVLTVSAATFSVTVVSANGTMGSVSPTSASASPDSWSSDITATPNAGYRFVNWTSSGGGITINNSSSATTQIKATSTGGTLTANFAAATYHVTLDNQSATTAGDAYVDATYNTTTLTTITKPTKTYYTFGGYYTETGGNGTQIIDADGNWLASKTGFTNSSKKSIITENKTLYAKWTETKYAVTVAVDDAAHAAGNIDCSAAGWTPGKSGTAQIGNVTDVTITVPAGASGYTYTGGHWTLTGGVTLVSGELTNPSITVKATATGSATFTYAEDLSTGWYLHSGNDGYDGCGYNGKSKNSNAFYKLTWVSTEFEKSSDALSASVGYATRTLAAGDVLFFELTHGSSYYKNAWYMESSTGDWEMSNTSNWVFTTGASGLCVVYATVPGEYQFKVDYSGANPVVRVKYPELSNCVRGSWDDWAWTHTLAGTTDLSTSISLSANTTYTFKVYYNNAHYGKSGTLQRSNSTSSNTLTGLTTDGSDITLKTDLAGSYTFHFNTSSKDIYITYPTAYTVTYGVGTGFTSMGAVSVSPATTSGSYVLAGTSITFTATPNLGYKFVGWYDNAACTGEAVSTNASYNIASLGANTTLYAKFDYRDLYIHTDCIWEWGTAKMTQSTTNRAVYTYEFDPLDAKTTPVGEPPIYNGGWHFQFVNTTVDPNNNRAYTYDGVQTPTGSGIISNDQIHKTADGNPTIQFYLTQKSKVTITLTLQSTNDATKPTVNIAADPYYTITTAKGGSGAAGITISPASVEARSDANSAEITATIAPGYTFVNWTAGGTITINSPNATTTTIKATGAGTLTANATANSYTVHFDGNGNTGGSMDDMLARTYGEAFNLTANGFTKTGYSFAGWATTADGAVTYANEANVSNLTTVNNGTATLYAKWSPVAYTVTLDGDEEHNKTAGNYALSGGTATFDAALPSFTGTLPTAADGYAFMGFYSEQNGNGVQVIDANGAWIATAAGYTSGGNWEHEGNTTLYAYFKQAEITAVELSASILDPVAAGGTGFITANPTIAPTPSGTTKVCWELLYDNDNPVEEHNAISTGNGEKPNEVKFSIAGLAAGGYKIKATLALGNTCPATPADVLSEREVSFSIASGFTVTIQYKDASGNTIASSTTSPGKATAWTEISAPDIFGYTFSTWVLGDGITANSALTTREDFQFKATFNGTLTAQYTKNKYVYLDLSQQFSNSGAWTDPWVYFYSDNPWVDGEGVGAQDNGQFHKNYKEAKQMHQIGSSNIWYADFSEVSVYSSYIAFTWGRNDGQKNFNSIDVIYRSDFTEGTPLFVPPTTATAGTSVNGAKYFYYGYWTNYVGEDTGYTLYIYNAAGTDVIKREKLTSDDKRVIMTATVDLNANTVYPYEIYRNSGYYHKNSTAIKSNNSGTAYNLETTGSKGSIKTSAAGNYEFKLGFNGTNLQISVTYPAKANDYRLVYKDSNSNHWTGATSRPAGWGHPSRVISKENNAVDTISFFIDKGKSPQIQIQQITNITNEGDITWTNVGSPIDVSSVDSTAVWNFKVTQDESGGISSVDNIGAYTGTYYIRCNALNSNWDHYTTDGDHRMTYSSFSESAANSFGEKYSHYKAKWCPRNTNIAFCIANDYSPCITDTLKQDVGNPYSNTDTEGTLKNDGDNGHSGSQAYLDRYSANVRFMWNRKTNKISRAYVSAATSGRAKFLVLRANQVIKGEDDKAESDEGITNGVLFTDKENWMYERTLKIKPGTKFKLFACYAEADPSEANAQYFRGAWDSDQFTSDANSVVLIGGTSESYQLARIVYDFKTNRLLAAWLPSGVVDGDNAINADVMIIREHQESARCITFANNSANLSGVKTVYGVMKFNRWILNNRGGSADEDKDHARPDHIAEDLANYHAPLTIENQKSTYERRLYFISFPFDVRVGDIFGFGQYGSYWALQYYDGLSRAKNGYWLDSKPNWKYISPTQVANGYTLKANEGYILELNLSAMAADNTSFWSNGISTIELYFPSTVNQETLKQTNCTIPALNDDYKCTINRGTAEGDRRVKDSYWRCIGVPSYNLYNSALKDGSGNTISWKTDYTWYNDEREFPFIYMWNKTDNTLTPQSTSTFLFQPMHAYLTQIKSAIVWTAVSAKPSSIVAHRARKEANNEHEWRIELRQDTTFLDQTYVRMTNLEQVTDSFDFGQDLVKELNSRSNIYTFIGYEKVAANSMTVHTDQTTVIPVGANIRADGEYTFAMPEGTNGVGVTLVDTEANIRTSLSALDYTVSLEAGEYTGRFVLEISPVQNTPTDIEAVSVQPSEVRKVMIDGILYIVKDGKMYDARGARVE